MWYIYKENDKCVYSAEEPAEGVQYFTTERISPIPNVAGHNPVLQADFEQETFRWATEPTVEYQIAVVEAAIATATYDAIVDGCDVELADGTVGTYALEETDQINLTTAATAVAMGAAGYPYHANRELCRMYSAEDITRVSTAATMHKIKKTTYSNHLLTWVRRCTTLEEVNEVSFGKKLPDDLLENMTTILASSGCDTSGLFTEESVEPEVEVTEEV